jgi:hypothetical protein
VGRGFTLNIDDAARLCEVIVMSRSFKPGGHLDSILGENLARI